jgi:entericidin B
MVRKAISIILIGGTILTIAACNTVRGAGQDVESVSNAASNAMH